MLFLIIMGRRSTLRSHEKAGRKAAISKLGTITNQLYDLQNKKCFKCIHYNDDLGCCDKTKELWDDANFSENRYRRTAALNAVYEKIRFCEDFVEVEKINENVLSLKEDKNKD